MIIGFSRAKGRFKIFSRLISLIEKRPYSHAYFKYTCPATGILMVSQASKGLVNEMSYEIFLQNNIPVEEIDINLDKSDALGILRWCKTKQGTDYGTDQILTNLYKKIFKKSIGLDNKEKRMICSEYIIRGIQQVRIYFGRDIVNLDEVTPSNLNKILKDWKANGY